ncbi:MAG: alpha/beta hydrolase [Gammaproteobacteria bacterium]
MSAALEAVVIEPAAAADADAAVIWLHGLGADGHDFEPIVPHLGLDPALAVRFVFPHAPAMPVTINNGMVMPAWYDILEMELGRRVDEAGLRRSAAAVAELIAAERARGIDAGRIVLAGFSQGGAVGFELALTYPERLAGLVALSTYFATAESIAPHPANTGLPIFIGHGLHDPLVPEAMGRDSERRLTALGHPVEYRTYAVEHGVDLDEIRDIGVWINARLGA